MKLFFIILWCFMVVCLLVHQTYDVNLLCISDVPEGSRIFTMKLFFNRHFLHIFSQDKGTNVADFLGLC